LIHGDVTRSRRDEISRRDQGGESYLVGGRGTVENKICALGAEDLGGRLLRGERTKPTKSLTSQDALLPHSSTMQPIAASVLTASRPPSTLVVFMLRKPTRSTSATISPTRSAADVSPRREGEQKRK
jgi:hypothetical protein